MVHYRSGRGPLPSCRPPTKHLVELGRVWAWNLAGRGDRGTQIGGENVPLLVVPKLVNISTGTRFFHRYKTIFVSMFFL